MPKDIIARNYHNIVSYSEKDWDLLSSKRNNASDLLRIFEKKGFHPFVYGSIARGNVHQGSDIDVVFINPVPTYQIEFLLRAQGYERLFREIIMATPNDTLKLYIHLSELESITIPLTKFEKNNEEFYKFGGMVSLTQLQKEVRVPGIDKRLLFINPTEIGHVEYSILNREHIIAKEMDISLDTILERKRVLLKREKYGRTGVFLKEEIPFDQSTEEAIKKLVRRKSIIRKKLYRR